MEKWKKTHIQITSRKASLAWQLALPPHLSWLDPLTGWVARVVGIFFYTATHSQIESVGFMRGRRTRDVDSGGDLHQEGPLAFARKPSAVAQWAILWTTVKLSDYWDGWMERMGSVAADRD